MSHTYLLISNPPHGDANAKLIAREFKFTPAEALMRIRFPAPQIWFAGEDLAGLKRTGSALLDAGAKVRIINGSLLALIPAPDDLQTFSFDETHLTMKTDSATELVIPYQARVILVSCRLKGESHDGGPQTDNSSSQDTRLGFGVTGPSAVPIRSDSLAADLEDATDDGIVDAYFISESRVQRATLRSGRVNHAGLDSDAKSSEEENRAALLARWKCRPRASRFLWRIPTTCRRSSPLTTRPLKCR